MSPCPSALQPPRPLAPPPVHNPSPEHNTRPNLRTPRPKCPSHYRPKCTIRPATQRWKPLPASPTQLTGRCTVAGSSRWDQPSPSPCKRRILGQTRTQRPEGAPRVLAARPVFRTLSPSAMRAREAATRNGARQPHELRLGEVPPRLAASARGSEDFRRLRTIRPIR